MRKLNSTMVAISWTVTIIFGILFLMAWMNAARIQTPYGSPASSAPYILGMLLANSIIPGLLWLITYLTAPKVNGGTIQKTTKGGYGGGYSGGHNDNSTTSNFSAGYNGGENNSQNNNSNDGYNSGDLYN